MNEESKSKLPLLAPVALLATLGSSITGLAIGSAFLTGCDMRHECAEQQKIVDEIKAANAQANKDKVSAEERQRRLDAIGEKYLGAGTKKDQAFTVLQSMNDCGFEIREYRHEGARPWKAPELKPYLDEATKRNLQNKYKPGYSYFVAVMKKNSAVLVEDFISLDFSISDKEQLVENIHVHVFATSI